MWADWDSPIPDDGTGTSCDPVDVTFYLHEIGCSQFALLTVDSSQSFQQVRDRVVAEQH
jgi:hypothetical protein